MTSAVCVCPEASLAAEANVFFFERLQVASPCFRLGYVFGCCCNHAQSFSQMQCDELYMLYMCVWLHAACDSRHAYGKPSSSLGRQPYKWNGP